MIIIRPVKDNDLDGLLKLAHMAGDGLTTFPPDASVLKERIKLSKESFKSTVNRPGKERYFLVMEDTELGQIFGTSAIFATVGLEKPFYNYKILHITQRSEKPPVTIDTKLLSLANDYRGVTELATLFLAPSHRQNGNGSLLSRARYLLMASNPKRFAETVMAELRGWTDENDQSPFWEAIGRQFFNMDFTDADLINARGNSQFIADLMPKFPIYTNLLPKAAREVIGKPNNRTLPAMKILNKEGFKYRGAVDIFDGGPNLEIFRDNIKSLQKTKMGSVKLVENIVEGERYIISNPYYDQFRAMYGLIKVEGDENNPIVIISKDVGEALQVEVGSLIQILKA
ncbi:MAG: arginine N-succinyltransferase [Sphingomonadales bacterium]